MPPENMPLLHMDCFEPEATENQQMQVKLQKPGTSFPFVKEVYIYVKDDTLSTLNSLSVEKAPESAEQI